MVARNIWAARPAAYTDCLIVDKGERIREKGVKNESKVWLWQ